LVDYLATLLEIDSMDKFYFASQVDTVSTIIFPSKILSQKAISIDEVIRFLLIINPPIFKGAIQRLKIISLISQLVDQKVKDVHRHTNSEDFIEKLTSRFYNNFDVKFQAREFEEITITVDNQNIIWHNLK
jgi:hypothetical protein